MADSDMETNEPEDEVQEDLGCPHCGERRVDWPIGLKSMRMTKRSPVAAVEKYPGCRSKAIPFEATARHSHNWHLSTGVGQSHLHELVQKYLQGTAMANIRHRRSGLG